MRDSLGGAAWTVLFGLMAVLISGTAQALDLDNDDDGVIYVKELLTTANAQTVDGRMYYPVQGPGNILDPEATLGFGSPASIDLVVRYDFSGMVFTTAVGNGDLTLSTSGTNATTVRRGGQIGEDFVEFLVSSTDARARGDTLTLTLAGIGVSADSPGTVGMHVKERFDDDPLEKIASFPQAVLVMSAVDTTYKSMSPTALVATSFLSFAGATATAEPRQMAPVGSVQIARAGAAADDWRQQDGTAFGGGGTLADLINTGALDADGSSLMFTGDFSFASKVTLDTDMACINAGIPLLQRDDEERVTDTMESMKIAVTALTGEMFLCVHVLAADHEDAARIPDTDHPYMATVDFMPVGGTQAFTPATEVANLGAIMRDGTTIRLPYLTQFATYNQRIVIVNRGPAARYEFAFTEEDGVTAMPGADAEGMLPAGKTTYISLKYGDLVTLEGDFSRVSATLIVESEARHIDVSVSQTNANGGTSIETYSKTYNN